MSQYLTFFMRSPQYPDEFIELDNFCRTDKVYVYFNDTLGLPYEKITALSVDSVRDVMSAIDNDAIEIRNSINQIKKQIKLAKELNGSFDDKLTYITNANSTICDLRHDYQQLQSVFEYARVLMNFIVNRNGLSNPDKFIYAGIEVDNPTEDDIV